MRGPAHRPIPSPMKTIVGMAAMIAVTTLRSGPPSRGPAASAARLNMLLRVLTTATVATAGAEVDTAACGDGWSARPEAASRLSTAALRSDRL
jgi:hypothetical protein